nr:tetratricopeptide repeat protein [Deltaproteobacteria bacterium]
MLELGAPGRAFEVLQRFGDAAPPPVVLLRARALVAQGRVGEAVALVEAAKERDPEHRRQWEGVLGQLRALPARRGAPGDSR